MLADLASGAILVLIAFFGARVLLQSSSLVYLFFPLLAAGALLIGCWRGARGELPAAVTAILVTVPLAAVALSFYSGRTKPFIVLPVIVLIAVWIGVALARARVRWLAVAMLVVLLSVGGAFAGPRFVRLMIPRHDVNESVAPFTIHLVDGRTIQSRDLAGRVVVLDFWATWCVPCQRELPIVQRVYEKWKGDGGVAFFAIDGVMTDSPGEPGDTADRASRYFKQGHYTIPLAWDGDRSLEKSFRLAGFPTLIVLDRDGRVRMRHVGYMGSEDLEKMLSEKIEEVRRP